MKAPKGFTLIELLVILAIIAVIAAAGFVQVVERDDQARYEKTVSSYRILKAAIFGRDDTLVLNGTPVQSGYLHDVGFLPENLSELEQNIRTNPDGTQETITQPWGIIGHTAVEGTTGHFVDNVFPHIQVEGGWRGPYFPRADQANQPRIDGWGNNFVYSTATANGQPTFPVRLLSQGKGGESDTFNAAGELQPANADDLEGYERDYPFAEAGTIGSSRYEVAPVLMPSSITIEIPTQFVDDAAKLQSLFIGVIYPGLDINEQLFDSGNPHECLVIGSSDKPIIRFSDLVNEGDNSGVTRFQLTRNDSSGGLFFKIPFARRYQIAILGDQKSNSDRPFGTIGNRMLSVYPQVFTFLGGQAPPPQPVLDTWDVQQHGQIR